LAWRCQSIAQKTTGLETVAKLRKSIRIISDSV
jgi:hypothetical protein